MKQEVVLIASVVIVWAMLAAVYALVPGLDMPGYVRVWGGGAVIFALLVLALIRSQRQPR